MSTADTALSPGAPVLVGEADTGQLGDFGKALEEPAGGAGGGEPKQEQVFVLGQGGEMGKKLPASPWSPHSSRSDLELI